MDTCDTSKASEMDEICSDDIKPDILCYADRKDYEIEVEQKCERSDELIHHKDPVDDIYVRDELLKSLVRKEGIIEGLISKNRILETQLQSAVSAKFDAMARLDKIEGKEMDLSFKERQMEIEKEQLNNHIESLTDNLNKNAVDLMAVRHEHFSAAGQQEMDLKQKTEALRLANSKICDLTESNQLLKSLNEKNVLKLDEQIRESEKLMEKYENELKAKTDLMELYKENKDDHEAHINDLTVAVSDLKQMLNESVTECGRLETELKGYKDQHNQGLDAKDEIIKQLKQELKHANWILNGNKNDELEVLEHPSPDVAHRRLKEGMTLTEVHNQYYNVVKELQKIELDYNQLETDTKNSIKEWKEGTRQFYVQQLELKNLKAANEKLTEEMKDFNVEKIITRGELQNTRFQCKILKDENNRLKWFQAAYTKTFLQTPSTEQISLQTNDTAIAQSLKETNAIDNLIELKEQNQQLINFVTNLCKKIQEIDKFQSKLNEDSNATITASENLLRNCLEQNAELKRIILEMANSNRNTNAGKTSVGDTSIKSNPTTRNAFVQTQNSSFLEMEQTLRNKVKEFNDLKKVCERLQIEVRESTSEKYKLSADANLFSHQIKNLQHNVQTSQHRIQTLEEHNMIYLTTTNEQKNANKCLTDENVTVIRKLTDVQISCEHLQNEYRKLMDIKIGLETEVKALKLELAQKKVENETLTHKLKMLNQPMKQLEIETVHKEVGRSQIEYLPNKQESTESFMDEVMNTKRQIKPEKHEINNHQEIKCKVDTAIQFLFKPENVQIDHVEQMASNFSANNSTNAKSEVKESDPSQPISSFQVPHSRKRSRSSETIHHNMTLRSKKPHVSFREDTKFTDGPSNGARSSPQRFRSTENADDDKSSEESDDDINIDVCEEDDEESFRTPDLQSDLQYAARTRQQRHILHDALFPREESVNRDKEDEEPMARENRKIIDSGSQSSNLLLRSTRGRSRGGIGRGHSEQINSSSGYRIYRGGVSRGQGRRSRARARLH